jgi:AraC-like DNA-binding protein
MIEIRFESQDKNYDLRFTMNPFYETRPEEMFAFVSYKPDTIPHIHIQLELMYVINAEIQVTVDQQTKTLTNGDLAVIFPNCIHGRAIPLQNSSVNVAIVAVKPHLTGDFSNIILNFIPENPFLCSNAVSKEAVYAIHQLVELFKNLNLNEYNSVLIKSYMQIILGLVIPELTLKKNSGPEYNLIQKSVNYITENFHQQLSLESVADYVGASKCHLSAVFSHKLHIGFNQYLNNIRLNCAQDFMRNTDNSITQIAYDCGFGTVRTFNRVFEKNNQMTPSQFRNLQKIQSEDKS